MFPCRGAQGPRYPLEGCARERLAPAAKRRAKNIFEKGMADEIDWDINYNLFLPHKMHHIIYIYILP